MIERHKKALLNRASRKGRVLRELMVRGTWKQSEAMAFYSKTGDYPQKDWTHFRSLVGSLFERVSLGKVNYFGIEVDVWEWRWIGPTFDELVGTDDELAQQFADWEEWMLAEDEFALRMCEAIQRRMKQ